MAEFNLWLLILGIAAGAAVMWLVIGTLARRDDEVDAAERGPEAGWITRTIEDYGGRAPVELVEQILALHRRYLQGGPGVPLPQTTEGDVGAEAAAEEPVVEEKPPTADEAVRERPRSHRTSAKADTTEAKAR